MRQRSARRAARLAISTGVILLVARPALPCSVPVFRYALERWPADMYRLVVFHRGPLSEAQQADVKKLKALEESEYGMPPLGVFPVDVAGEVPKELAALWEKERESELPRAVLMYPVMTMPEGVAWAGSLPGAARTVGQISPVRQELARRLIDGQTAVWLLFESGDAEKDKAAAATLSEALKEQEKELRLPHQMDPVDAEYDMPLDEGIELKIQFSVIRTAARGGSETLLLSLLRGLLGEEMDESLPMAVPVFGRGRALAVIPQEQITEDTIAEVCWFMVGPCSCQVKAQNPGFDILLPVDWDGLVMGMIGADEALPPLTVPLIARPEEEAAQGAAEEAGEGAGEGTGNGPPAAVSDAATGSGEGPDETVASSPLSRNLIVTGAIVLAGLATATVLVLRRARGADRRKE